MVSDLPSLLGNFTQDNPPLYLNISFYFFHSLLFILFLYSSHFVLILTSSKGSVRFSQQCHCDNAPDMPRHPQLLRVLIHLSRFGPDLVLLGYWGSLFRPPYVLQLDWAPADRVGISQPTQFESSIPSSHLLSLRPTITLSSIAIDTTNGRGCCFHLSLDPEVHFFFLFLFLWLE